MQTLEKAIVIVLIIFFILFYAYYAKAEIIDTPGKDVYFPHSIHTETEDIKCSKCHILDKKNSANMITLKSHTLCKGCHAQQGGPTKCEGCHLVKK